jgi:hypothetical protein
VTGGYAGLLGLEQTGTDTGTALYPYLPGVAGNPIDGARARVRLEGRESPPGRIHDADRAAGLDQDRQIRGSVGIVAGCADRLEEIFRIR